MKTKEKANELVDKFSFNCRECDNAKLSALIAVDEILNIKSVDRDYDLSTYWEEVKQEIDNL